MHRFKHFPLLIVSFSSVPLNSLSAREDWLKRRVLLRFSLGKWADPGRNNMERGNSFFPLLFTVLQFSLPRRKKLSALIFSLLRACRWWRRLEEDDSWERRRQGGGRRRQGGVRRSRQGGEGGRAWGVGNKVKSTRVFKKGTKFITVAWRVAERRTPSGKGNRHV